MDTNVGEMPLDIFSDYTSDQLNEEWSWEYLALVFNDKGNIHTETGGDPIGMEIRAQAFAFTTSKSLVDSLISNFVPS